MSSAGRSSARYASGRVWPIAVMTSRANVRQPMVYLTLAAMPLAFFIVFTALAGRSLGQHVFVGAAIAYAVTGGVVSLPQTVVLSRMRHLHDMMLASPIRPLTYLLGLAMSRLLYISPAVVVVIVAFMIVGDVAAWRVLATLPCILLAWIFGCGVGFAISRKWDDPTTISSVANMIGYILVLVPPVYYPLTLLPDKFRLLVSVVPTAALAEIMRWSAGISAPMVGQLLFLLMSVVATTVICIWYASRDTRWREP